MCSFLKMQSLVSCYDHLCWTSSICRSEAPSTRLSTCRATCTDLAVSRVPPDVTLDSRVLLAPGGRGRWEGSRSGRSFSASSLPGLSSPAVSLCTRRALAALGPGLFCPALLSGHSQPLPTARACALACGFPAPYLLNKTFIKLCSDCPI